MLGYKTKTRPGLVALYDIRPGNGAGLFLQPRSLHWALVSVNQKASSTLYKCGADTLYMNKVAERTTEGLQTVCVD